MTLETSEEFRKSNTRLNSDSVLKSTLSGSEFHTLTTRSLIKKAALTRDTLRSLYSLY